MKRTVYLLIMLFALVACVEEEKSDEITIFMAGDSTMADKPYRDGNPEKGWGHVFPLYFKEGVKIENHARNGRSTKTFIDEGRWDSIVGKLSAGDYVIIEFGHNDSKESEPKRYAEANTDYADNLRRFVNDVREKGANPILATPVVRRHFENGELIETHGDYPKAVKLVAEEMNVTLFDIHASTRELVSRYGDELSKRLYLHIDTIEYPNMNKNRADDTHLSAYGAFKVCDIVKKELETQVPELTKFLKK